MPMDFLSFLACLDLHFIMILYLIGYQLLCVSLNCIYVSCGVLKFSINEYSILFMKWVYYSMCIQFPYMCFFCALHEVDLVAPL